MPRTLTPNKKSSKPKSSVTWSANSEIIGLEFELVTPVDSSVYPQYSIGLHAWFLNQVRSFDPELSAYLHDGESEKPFTISVLNGEIVSSGMNIQLSSDTTYRWYVTGLSHRVTSWMRKWVKKLPEHLYLQDVPLQIQACKIAHPATTYSQLLDTANITGSVALEFLSPTSFRRKKHHFPLPLPFNIFQSYLRRWNDFSNLPVETDDFLAWIDEHVIISRHQIASQKVLAGKQGAVTGFTGSIELSLAKTASKQPDYQRLFYALASLAPYCGTGHKTTFGLGQTRLGWSSKLVQDVPDVESVLAKRIEDLTEIFTAQRKRLGGERASEIAMKWATILARREMGDSLISISQDTAIPYETVKTYVKLARKALKQEN
ncbi:CRISPR-associated endoribonuclease Cas6 [Aetokthonos hydrillicola Thurmond2011]|jgi:CRISPR-associated endoribonuclease Cas6|uniref:CRISPR-associated endoribonuclease Cas6 n=1 Tax=Aetokthonos hydrillicola Thurmond2011 TaxID=2712845 RepID=A0AAP5M8T9_9CYAN|nr:CRISPR-associated endoribonuclease Cas6 [Aetokthonos hydrillicola]MBO3457351.1 CRISPR-associated endoribonuclease Cas6 [Aetokthonos hydrillicola CCALA 1050]MBW4586700.1 CRISPR-associated endoribonuclease Cas6 [Aetokthonos hydrillicola CCALA 1050]MDR9893973.1 CRISPR-associated endoribonuclease Cas6 [Aetokthonos hydrillicola Thurmond2011]